MHIYIELRLIIQGSMFAKSIKNYKCNFHGDPSCTCYILAYWFNKTDRTQPNTSASDISHKNTRTSLHARSNVREWKRSPRNTVICMPISTASKSCTASKNTEIIFIFLTLNIQCFSQQFWAGIVYKLMTTTCIKLQELEKI